MENQNPAAAQPQNKNFLAILAYIGPLVIVSYILGHTEPFVKYHIKQGLVLFSAEIIAWIGMSVMWFFMPIWGLLHIGIFILAIIGIINAAQGQQKPLPLVGHLAEKFKF